LLIALTWSVLGKRSSTVPSTLSLFGPLPGEWVALTVVGAIRHSAKSSGVSMRFMPDASSLGEDFRLTARTRCAWIRARRSLFETAGTELLAALALDRISGQVDDAPKGPPAR
jgi:hypothetical protein